jgi:hypothetical protein
LETVLAGWLGNWRSACVVVFDCCFLTVLEMKGYAGGLVHRWIGRLSYRLTRDFGSDDVSDSFTVWRLSLRGLCTLNRGNPSDGIDMCRGSLVKGRLRSFNLRV